MSGFTRRMLIAHFEGIHRGPNGDYPAVLEALAGVAADQAAWKPAASANSIWRIVEHLTASNEWLIEELLRGGAASPKWIEPAGGEEEWQASLARLRESHGRLMVVLDGLTDEQMQAVPDPEDGRTQWELLLSMAAHEACHAGQIDYLRGLQTG
jgi:uncharacterized damage-inducible protein DinB